MDAADDVSCRPDFSLFMYPWLLFANNKVPAWGHAYQLSSDFDGMDEEHPVSFFCQNEDDSTAPVEGTLAYYSKVKSLAPKGNARSSLHVFPQGGHGFGLCQGKKQFLEVGYGHCFVQISVALCVVKLLILWSGAGSTSIAIVDGLFFKCCTCAHLRSSGM